MPLGVAEDHRGLAEVATAVVTGRGGAAAARRIRLDARNAAFSACRAIRRHSR